MLKPMLVLPTPDENETIICKIYKMTCLNYEYAQQTIAFTKSFRDHDFLVTGKKDGSTGG